MTDNADNTAAKQLAPFAFKPGQSGNPAGRPKGSRNKLSEAFISALQTDFEEHGQAVIEQVRAEEPAAYMRVIASLLPKQVELDPGALGNITDEQVARFVATIDAWLAANPDEGSAASVLQAVSETAVVPSSRNGVH